MQEPEADGTRVRLINAAARLLWERSYVAAGVDDLCRHAGARKGSFYHFFASKTALAVEAIEAQWTFVRHSAFDPAAAGPEGGLDRLRVLTTRLDAIQREAQTRTLAILGSPFGHLGQEMAHQEEALRRAVQAIFDAQCLYLEQWLTEAVELGQLPAGETAARARRVLALIEGALLLAKVADAPDLFLDTCRALPAVAGAPRPAAAPPTHRSPSLPEFG
jgi:TetR/AcrR family transcriptional repressor of nem operon